MYDVMGLNTTYQNLKFSYNHDPANYYFMTTDPCLATLPIWLSGKDMVLYFYLISLISLIGYCLIYRLGNQNTNYPFVTSNGNIIQEVVPHYKRYRPSRLTDLSDEAILSDDPNDSDYQLTPTDEDCESDSECDSECENDLESDTETYPDTYVDSDTEALLVKY